MCLKLSMAQLEKRRKRGREREGEPGRNVTAQAGGDRNGCHLLIVILIQASFFLSRRPCTVTCSRRCCVLGGKSLALSRTAAIMGKRVREWQQQKHLTLPYNYLTCCSASASCKTPWLHVRRCMGKLVFDQGTRCRCQHYSLLIDFQGRC